MLEKVVKKLFRCPVWGFCVSPVAFIFKLIVNNRNRRYDTGRKKAVRLDAVVISIGNITVGGSGKTPFVDLLARYLKDKGFHPAVLSRGYGRKSKEIVVVSDGKDILADSDTGGDEPVLLANRLPGVPVLVNSDRAETGQLAIDRFACDVLILDDAFQHRRLQRDFDFVVMDATDPWGNGWLLPAGPLREPLSSLKRANGILLSKIAGDIPSESLLKEIERYTDAPVLMSKYLPSNWVSIPNNRAFSPDHLEGKKVIGFAGIANPDHFRKTLIDLNVQLVDFILFRDHHAYRTKDWQRIVSKASQTGADGIVTTEKDSVKLSFLHEHSFPVYFLKMDLKLIGGIETLQDVLRPVLKK